MKHGGLCSCCMWLGTRARHVGSTHEKEQRGVRRQPPGACSSAEVVLRMPFVPLRQRKPVPLVLDSDKEHERRERAAPGARRVVANGALALCSGTASQPRVTPMSLSSKSGGCVARCIFLRCQRQARCSVEKASAASQEWSSSWVLGGVVWGIALLRPR